MTYQSDPTRWTQLGSSADGPADAAAGLLRDVFQSGHHEGPSDLQMRTLALKLAAIGTGATIAAGASAAHASATAGGATLGSAAGGAAVGGAAGGALTALKTGGAFTFGKIAASVALVGAVATSAVYFQRNITMNATPELAVSVAQPVGARQQDAVVAPLVAQVAPVVTPVASATSTPLPSTETLRAPVAAAAAQNAAISVALNVAPAAVESEKTGQVEPAPSAEPSGAREEVPATVASVPGNKPHHVVRPERHVAAGSAAVAASEPATPSAVAAPRMSPERVAGQRQQVSEIELLRNARAALAAHPREAYRLAEQHKALYPQGVFAQERDALAVEAAQRAGELKLARQLAESFVQRYPSSPHAHRFRETMNLQ